MNTVLIVGLVIVIIVAIWLAVMYINPSYLIQTSTSLNIGTKSQTVIPASSLDAPDSSRYYYEGWFFISGNQKIYQENVLFNRGNQFVVTLKGSTLNLYTSSTGAIDSTSGIYDPSNAKPLVFVPNFPFQKWTQLVINVDSMTVDLYIDGQFVKNEKNATTIAGDLETPITYGNQFTLGNVVRFQRPAGNINPQGVWNDYMKGSGQSQSLTNYHLNAIVTKNSKQTLNQRLV